MRDEQAESAQQETVSRTSRRISAMNNLGIQKFRQHGRQIVRVICDSKRCEVAGQEGPNGVH